MNVKANKGFTLIELAIVIVIVAILAAVAVPRFSNVTRTAQGSVVQDMMAQVTSAASIYTAEQQRTPTAFTDYVSGAALGNNQTLTLQNVGNASAAPCVIAANTITCSGGAAGTRFPDLGATAVINFNQGPGTFSLNCAAPAGAAPAGQAWQAASCRYAAAAAAG